MCVQRSGSFIYSILNGGSHVLPATRNACGRPVTFRFSSPVQSSSRAYTSQQPPGSRPAPTHGSQRVLTQRTDLRGFFTHSRQQRAQDKSWQRAALAGGIVLGGIVIAQTVTILNLDRAMISTAAVFPEGLQVRGGSFRPLQGDRLDASPAEEAALNGKDVVVHTKPGSERIVDEAGTELVPTGTKTIPHFPVKVDIPSTTTASGGATSPTTDEYTLLGVGVRTVSFLSIEVYAVGIYVRTSDVPVLQAAFVRHVNPLATALIPGEKEKLRAELLGGDTSLDIWDTVLREAGCRSLVRVVPVRNTDFQHLRDGWVRGITSRTQAAARAGSKEYDDEGFGEAMKAFKGIFGGRGKAPWGSTLLLTRDENGELAISYEEVKRTKKDGKEVVSLLDSELLGVVADERISRQVWLGYLGGKNVSSEGTRRSVVDGVMELVERPGGAVGTQVT